ncbi:hypothetical protein [Pectinatus cerevisiiphilus]|uniref:hypothetical protein n=1 Tax=Pectinatus cerevisiiphilus TaxID=86956 RepID=UPI0018C7EFFD|nr:hypothetical protein [Pectinatus cerevisiiphilus]
MKDYFEKANKSRDDDRYNYWQKHRQIATSAILEASQKSAASNSIIILGAGNCDDIDINTLASVFSRIVLVDIAEISLNKAYHSFFKSTQDKVMLRGNVNLLPIDTSDFYLKLKELLEERASVEDILNLVNYTRISMKHSILQDLKGKFDIVVSSAIYTQLFEARLNEILNSYSNFYDSTQKNKILDELQGFGYELIDQYNNLLTFLTKEHGVIVSWSDVAHIHELSTSQASGPPKHLPVDKLFPSATHGISGLMSNLEPNTVVMKYWQWPFNHIISYYVVLLYGISHNGNRQI